MFNARLCLELPNQYYTLQHYKRYLESRTVQELLEHSAIVQWKQHQWSQSSIRCRLCLLPYMPNCVIAVLGPTSWILHSKLTPTSTRCLSSHQVRLHTTTHIVTLHSMNKAWIHVSQSDILGPHIVTGTCTVSINTCVTVWVQLAILVILRIWYYLKGLCLKITVSNTE